jgi:hypothetical protein
LSVTTTCGTYRKFFSRRLNSASPLRRRVGLDENITGLRPAASQVLGATRGEFLAPAPHRFVGDDDAPLGKDQLDIP